MQQVFKSRRSVAWLMMVVIIWAGLGYAWRYQLRDDAFIYYTYVRNLLEGNGFVFNVGERVNACTSVLFPVLVAAVSYPFRSAPESVIPLVGYGVGMLALLATALLGSRLFLKEKNRTPGYWIFPIILLAYPRLRAGVGMESHLVMGCLVATVLAYDRRRYQLSSALLALAVLARPDSLLLALPLGVHFLIAERKTPPVKAIALFVLILLPWILFSLWYFGSPLPNTLGAKLAQGEAKNAMRGMLFLQNIPEALTMHRFSAVVESALILLGLWVVVRDGAPRPVVMLLVWGLLYILAYAFLLNAPGYPWYYTPIVLVPALLLTLAVSRIVSVMKGAEAGSQAILFACRGILFLICIGLGARIGLTVVKSKSIPPSKFRQYRAVAARLNKTAPEGASLASVEIGVLGYFYEQGKIIDGLGLIHPDVVEKIRSGKRSWYVNHYRPDYILARRPPRPRSEGFVKESWFLEQYRMLPAQKEFGNFRLYQRRLQ